MSTNYQVYKYDLAHIDEDTLGELDEDDECKRANSNIKNICLVLTYPPWNELV